MLNPEKIKEIESLLAAGELSQRKIAELTGVSRAVVHRIATGKRRKPCPKPKKEEWSGHRNDAPFQRCPICGGKVLLPCLACFVRNRR